MVNRGINEKRIFNQKLKTLIIPGAPGATRTHDTQIRNLVLYPPELRGQRRFLLSQIERMSNDFGKKTKKQLIFFFIYI